MSRTLGFFVATICACGVLPATAAPPVALSTCVVSASISTGKHGAVAAKVTCQRAKDLIQMDLIADWPKKHHAKTGHYCASPPPYLPACTTDAANLKLAGIRHYSYRGSIQITGEDVAVTSVTGSAASFCTTTSAIEIDCFFDGKR
jgi:hypothetical protein